MQTEARVGVAVDSGGQRPLNSGHGGSVDAKGPQYLSHTQQQHSRQKQAQIGTVSQLLAGGVAGALSKTCTAPLARLTILFQDKLCDTCGGTGYPESISTCHQCNQVSEHIYCMKNVLECIPEIWFCGACQPSSGLDSICTTPADQIEQKEKDNNFNLGVTSFQLDEQMQTPGKQRRISEICKLVDDNLFIPSKSQRSLPPKNFTNKRSNILKTPEASKVQYLPAEEIGYQRSASLMLRKNHVRPQAMSTITGGNAKRSLVRSPGLTKSKVLQSKEQVAAKSFLQNGDTSGPSNNEKATWRTGKGASRTEGKGIPSGEMKKVACEEPMRTGQRLNQTIEKPLNKVMEASSSEGPLAPLPKVFEGTAIWTGSFEIRGNICYGNIYAGLQAHQPTRVSCKASEASRRMPGSLQVQILPRTEIWPRNFQVRSPDANDVGLYFSPCNNKSSKDGYLRLLKMVLIRDLAIRCCMEDLDLLIFTSKQLSVDPNRLNSETYLWGVFFRLRKRGHVPSIKEWQRDNLLLHGSSQPNQSCDDVISMDIDMEAGRDVGRVDKVVGRYQPPRPGAVPKRTPMAAKDNRRILERPPDFLKPDPCKTLSKVSMPKIIERQSAGPCLTDAPPGFSELQPLVKIRHFDTKANEIEPKHHKCPVPKSQSSPRLYGPAQMFRPSPILTESSKHKQSKMLDLPVAVEKSSGFLEKTILERKANNTQIDEDHRIVGPSILGACLPLFPTDTDVQSFKVDPPMSNSRSKISRGDSGDMRNDSLSLSLARPKYLQNGDDWIAAPSKESLGNGDYDNGEELQLTL